MWVNYHFSTPQFTVPKTEAISQKKNAFLLFGCVPPITSQGPTWSHRSQCFCKWNDCSVIPWDSKDKVAVLSSNSDMKVQSKTNYVQTGKTIAKLCWTKIKENCGISVTLLHIQHFHCRRRFPHDIFKRALESEVKKSKTRAAVF